MSFSSNIILHFHHKIAQKSIKSIMYNGETYRNGDRDTAYKDHISASTGLRGMIVVRHKCPFIWKSLDGSHFFDNLPGPGTLQEHFLNIMINLKLFQAKRVRFPASEEMNSGLHACVPACVCACVCVCLSLSVCVCVYMYVSVWVFVCDMYHVFAETFEYFCNKSRICVISVHGKIKTSRVFPLKLMIRLEVKDKSWNLGRSESILQGLWFRQYNWSI